MRDGYVPRGGIFEGDSIIGDARGYWGGSSPSVPAVPTRRLISQRPDFAHVPVAAYPRAFGAMASSLMPGVRALMPGAVVPAPIPVPAMPTQPIAPTQPVAPSRPSTMDTLYRAELIGRGHGIFEQSVMACPTGAGYSPQRGGIFDGPTIDQQCVYADREQRQVPQARKPEKPIDTDAVPEAPIGFGYGPDGLGFYRRY